MAKVIVVYGDGSKAVWVVSNSEVRAVTDYLYGNLINDNEILDPDEPVDLSA